MSVKLYYPENWANFDPKIRETTFNGCGPGGWKYKFNSILGCNVKPACNIHDFMYTFGPAKLSYKDYADRVFLNNMLRIIKYKGGWRITQWARRKIAYGYYVSCCRFGGPSFWEGRNAGD